MAFDADGLSPMSILQLDSQATEEALLERARQLASTGEDEAAKGAYLEVLQRDPAHFNALNELGNLAFASDHLSAAQTAYRQATRCHPANPAGWVNLGNLLYKTGDYDQARLQYETAVALDVDLAEAHQGLARTLVELGEVAKAETHWQRGFSGNAVVMQRCRSTTLGVPVLLLVSAKGGNIPTQRILDDKVFKVAALFTEYHDPTRPLPPHDMVFNAIGDADLCSAALTGAENVLSRTTAPVFNSPKLVRKTGRKENARRFDGLQGVITPSIRPIARDLSDAADLTFPLLLRSPGFHTGQHFKRVARREDLASAVAVLPGKELLAISYLDARGADGMARKYRVMMIGGVLFPLHLAISADWKVHYYTAAMASNTGFRKEERQFLEDPLSVLGAGVMSALTKIGQTMGLDYAGIDFGLSPDRSLLFFEANATMVVSPPNPDPIWDYRRPSVDRVLQAVRLMILANVRQSKFP